MADAFINYSREDAEIAEKIAASLSSRGISVWWDRTIAPGLSFVEVIEAALEEAGCIITIWSENSVLSNWVQAEADFAIRHDKLLPIAIGKELSIPLGFRRIQTDFVDSGDLAHDDWLSRLHGNVRQFLSERGDNRQSTFGVSEPPTPEIGDHPGIEVDPSLAGKKAFISYADENEDIAIDLVKHLESSGCPCWISFRDVDPGDDYRTSITQAMDQIAFLVLVYSGYVNKSFDIATELILARKRRKKRFVLKTDKTEPDGPVEYELATVQWIDCQTNRQAAFEKIAQRAELF